MADSFTMQWRGNRDRITLRKFTKLPNILNRRLHKVVHDGCIDIKQDAEFNSPRDQDKLVRGWRAEMTGLMEGRVYNIEEHALPMETGFHLRQLTQTGWRVIRIPEAASKYSPTLILSEREPHPKDEPGGYRMLERARVENEKVLIKKSTNILARSWAEA